MNESTIKIDGENNDVGYIYLPDHPGKGTENCVANSISLRSLFNGNDKKELLEILSEVDVIFDINIDGKLIGIEVIV